MERKHETSSLNRSRCTLGHQGASSQIETPYFSIPFGLHCERRWEDGSIQHDFGETFEGLQSESSKDLG
jgi:hypothetical protein